MRLLRRLTARRQRRSGRGRRPRVGAAAAVEPGLPREGGAGGRDEPGREARDGTVGRDEAAAAAADPAGLPDEELEYVVYDVAGAGAPLGEVVLVQQAEGLAWKWKESCEMLHLYSIPSRKQLDCVKSRTTWHKIPKLAILFFLGNDLSLSQV